MGNNFLSQEEIDALLGKKGDEPVKEEAVSHEQTSSPKSSLWDKHSENLELILDFPLKLSVRLGDVKKTLEELRQVGPGHVFELDRLVSDPVDLFVNGKLIARGEVVVVDENFGIRINQILTPVERIKKLK